MRDVRLRGTKPWLPCLFSYSTLPWCALHGVHLVVRPQLRCHVLQVLVCGYQRKCPNGPCGSTQIKIMEMCNLISPSAQLNAGQTQGRAWQSSQSSCAGLLWQHRVDYIVSTWLCRLCADNWVPKTAWRRTAQVCTCAVLPCVTIYIENSEMQSSVFLCAALPVSPRSQCPPGLYIMKAAIAFRVYHDAL